MRTVVTLPVQHSTYKDEEPDQLQPVFEQRTLSEKLGVTTQKTEHFITSTAQFQTERWSPDYPLPLY
jgi:hypothetical protein